MSNPATGTSEDGPDKDWPDPAIIDFVARSGLTPIGAETRFERLPGGVSSDIWLVRAGSAVCCVKRALQRLRVAADWRAPIERNANEAAWIRSVSSVLPQAVPRLLAEDPGAGMFAMEYLPPQSFKGWKAQLQHGRVVASDAAEVGRRLARIHGKFARSCDIEAEFTTDAIFHAIRLEPYLLAAARAHPDRAATLHRLAEITAGTKLTLVHGDISPKNILIGPHGPVFIDAECAWFGDPAFDLAFCLNHLLLKCLWVPAAALRLITAFAALADAYLAGVDWEPVEGVEHRTAHLLPALLLARIDGKSPVEYLTEEPDKNIVRRVARALLADPPDRLADIRQIWKREIRE
ncbi:MAG: aminoglycoside phosphotransferase family protein [Alphaproteobacteria bacterium]|nr:aminoglycoside phosphotransferase family protein [Alphaproteobacteria bacterium]MBV9374458.1 aminoglycoside phosphotransferase family protein [Alphaproteobacteria bacterium]